MKSLTETIREFGDTQNTLADVLGITKSTLSWKINGKTDFKQSEIKMIADRYNLTGEEIKSMFFG